MKHPRARSTMSRTGRRKPGAPKMPGNSATMDAITLAVPRDLGKAFNRTYTRAERGALLARLLEQAVEERQRLVRRRRAIDELLRLRKTLPPERSRRASRASQRPPVVTVQRSSHAPAVPGAPRSMRLANLAR